MISIRPATAEDEALIAGIIRASLDVSYARFLPHHQYQKILDMSRPAVVAREHCLGFAIAEADGAQAGVMLLRDNYLDQLWTHPDFMGRGVGSLLLAYAEERARAGGFDELTLDCFEKNVKALAFYDRKGFTLRRTYMSVDYLRGEYIRSLAKPLRDPA